MRRSTGKNWHVRQTWATVTVLVVAAGCGSTSANNPTNTSTAVAAAGDTSNPIECPAASPPQAGQCAFVDWDLIAVDGATVTIQVYLNSPGCAETVNRVEIDETDTQVRLTAIATYTGDDGTSCPTALGTVEATTQLAAPLDERQLVGCRPEESFAPANGYNEPAPRTETCR